MSFLQNHKGKKIKITGYLGARVPNDLEKDFKEYCDKLGISVADALRLLVENELKSASHKKAQAAPVAEIGGRLVGTNAEYIAMDEFATADKEARPETPLPSGGRFTVSKWKRDGLLPCAVCGKWVSAANFARHAKQEHNVKTKDLFTSPMDKRADEMAADYDKEKSQG